MRRRRQVLVFAVWGAGLLAIPGAASTGAVPAARGPAVRVAASWGRAIEVPGLGALNKGGNAGVDEVSCASAGSCAAGGDYADNASQQGFVVVERDGVWGRAIEVPGLGALNTNGGAAVDSVSCASAGNCAAGGDFDYDYTWGFVAVERNGVWGRAITAPGLDALASGRYTDINSVSCASPGNCAAGGDYEDTTGSGLNQGFVVSQRNGRWTQAIEVPAGALSGYAAVNSVSCAPDGGCAAGGDYNDGNGHQQGFVT